MKLRTIALVIVTLVAGDNEASETLGLSDDSTIIVSADESWEEADNQIIHFRGNFEIRTPGWSIMADQATLFGQLDDPKSIVADGSPVRFFFRSTDPENPSTTTGEGDHLEYQRDAATLTLSGNAMLTSGERVMRSSEIHYDLEQQKLKAGGPEGVHITVVPDKP